MTRKFLCVYYDQEEAWNQLGDGERGRLLSALISYAKRGEEPALTGAERSAWAFLKVQVDADNNSYDARIEQRREAGKASAAKRQRKSTSVNEHDASLTENEVHHTHKKDNNNINNNNINNNNKNNRTGTFKAPTLEEVEAYCRERNNTVDAQRFFDYYTSNGWKVGKNPMKDWKAAVRTWERSGFERTPSKPEKLTNNIFLEMLMEEGETL